MIIYSTAPLIVGRRYEREVIDHNGEPHVVPFVVLRQSTREEWREYTEDADKKEAWFTANCVVVDSYYEISMD